MRIQKIPTRYYQQFDADFHLHVPGEGYGGWKTEDLPMDIDATALIVMHAWETGTPDRYPGWYRAVEYLPRARDIGDHILPSILSAARKAKVAVIHVVSDNDYYSHLPGYRKTVLLAGEEESVPLRIEADDVSRKLKEFRYDHVFPGRHNRSDIETGFKNMEIMSSTGPGPDEYIVKTSGQLFRLCREFGIGHLIYTGFALNACLLLSPGGMLDMSRRGLLCSTIAEATTAVENKESARKETHKKMFLWYTALNFGFVYHQGDIMQAFERSCSENDDP